MNTKGNQLMELTKSQATEIRAATISQIISQRQPFAKKLEEVKTNLQKLKNTLDELEKQRKKLISIIEDNRIKGRLKEIDYSKILLEIESELVCLDQLKSRFSRDTLNIGVIGRARQGKSRLLQSLTGLSSSEIPDGDDWHCTGVRSNIHHNPDVQTYGEVTFHSESSFLNEVIYPYYEQLHLFSFKPNSLEEFANSSIPPLPSERQQLREREKYSHLCEYHLNLLQYRKFFSQTSPQVIQKEEIREFVAQDTIDGKRTFFNYLAVKEVKICCTFPNQDIGKIALIDMPGLGDTGIGDDKRMIETLGQDIDFVLFVRMPKSTGDFWGVEDVDLYDLANTALKDLPINEWCFLILNRISSESGKGDNYKNCQSFKDKLEEKNHNSSSKSNFQKIVIADCANSEEAQTQILDEVLIYLTQRIELLDRKYASACESRVKQLQKNIQIKINETKDSWKVSSQDDWFPTYVRLFEKLWRQLSNQLEGLISAMINDRDNDDQDFKVAVEKAIANCRVNTGIPEIQIIEEKRNTVGSYDIAYNEFLHEVRTHLSKQFLSLDEALKKSLEEAKSKVVKVLKDTINLGQICDKDGTEFLQEITKKIPENLEVLRLGFETLTTFDLQYRGLIQHRIRKHLDVLTPDRTTYSINGNFFDLAWDVKKKSIVGGTPSAKKISENLSKAQIEAVNKCEKELNNLLTEPTQASFAIVEEFVDRVLRAEEVKTQWQIFLQEIAPEIWNDQFGSIMARSQLRQRWNNTIQEVEEQNSSELFDFMR